MGQFVGAPALTWRSNQERGQTRRICELARTPHHSIQERKVALQKME